MTVIHVHQQRIRQNIKKDLALHKPPIIVRGRPNKYANTVEIAGPCRIVYSPDKPLSCGARVWIETSSEVVIVA